MHDDIPKNHHLEHRTYGVLDGVLIKSSHSSDKAVVFLHGAGAYKENLLPLAYSIPALNDYHGICLDAPLYLPSTPQQRFWFPIEPWMLKELANPKPDLKQLDNHPLPRYYDDALAMLHQAMEMITGSYSQVILLGFSQGGMLAIHHVIKESVNQKKAAVSGLVLSSTTIVHPEVIQLLPKLSHKAKEIPITQSHGCYDEVISYGCGEASYKILAKHFSKYGFFAYKEGHTLTPETLHHYQQWLSHL
ncbi:MAG: alpha/beta fold hydrolase [Proteobacteria bacterium]|nr:alpha/beta fold hydrolase [Pseudomonadota bacterium]